MLELDDMGDGGVWPDKKPTNCLKRERQPCDSVCILMVSGAPFPHMCVGHALIERIDEDGSIWVRTANGHNCPWKKAPDAVWSTPNEAMVALKEWSDRTFNIDWGKEAMIETSGAGE